MLTVYSTSKLIAQINDSWGYFETWFSELIVQHPDFTWLLFGDFNIRTGTNDKAL